MFTCKPVMSSYWRTWHFSHDFR